MLDVRMVVVVDFGFGFGKAAGRRACSLHAAAAFWRPHGEKVAGGIFGEEIFHMAGHSIPRGRRVRQSIPRGTLSQRRRIPSA